MKKILFTVCTHGDEQVGLWLLNNFPQGYNEKLSWQTILNNPQAMFLGVRYTESDLNRSFNQKRNKTYEEKRAKELTPIIQQYDVVYDIHQTFMKDQMLDCIFVNKVDKETINAISCLKPRYVIVDDNPDYNGHFVTSVAKVGITIEYSKSGNYVEETARLQADVKNVTECTVQKVKRIFMKTYLAVPRQEIYEALKLQNFVPLTAKEMNVLGIKEKGVYYPIFVNGYPDHYCFINKEISSNFYLS